MVVFIFNLFIILFIFNIFNFLLQEHIQEIFSTYGKIKSVEMPMDRLHPHLSRCSAYVEFETPEEAQKALKYMDGGTMTLLHHAFCAYMDRYCLAVTMCFCAMVVRRSD